MCCAEGMCCATGMSCAQRSMALQAYPIPVALASSGTQVRTPHARTLNQCTWSCKMPEAACMATAQDCMRHSSQACSAAIARLRHGTQHSNSTAAARAQRGHHAAALLQIRGTVKSAAAASPCRPRPNPADRAALQLLRGGQTAEQQRGSKRGPSAGRGPARPRPTPVAPKRGVPRRVVPLLLRRLLRRLLRQLPHPQPNPASAHPGLVCASGIPGRGTPQGCTPAAGSTPAAAAGAAAAAAGTTQGPRRTPAKRLRGILLHAGLIGQHDT
jgi:hypothetical protein